MRRLDTRIGELEARVGRCRDCKPTVELVHHSSRRRPPRIDHCASCGEPVEQITVWVAFDPKTGAQL